MASSSKYRHSKHMVIAHMDIVHTIGVREDGICIPSSKCDNNDDMRTVTHVGGDRRG